MEGKCPGLFEGSPTARGRGRVRKKVYRALTGPGVEMSFQTIQVNLPG